MTKANQIQELQNRRARLAQRLEEAKSWLESANAELVYLRNSSDETLAHDRNLENAAVEVSRCQDVIDDIHGDMAEVDEDLRDLL